MTKPVVSRAAYPTLPGETRIAYEARIIAIVRSREADIRAVAGVEKVRMRIVEIEGDADAVAALLLLRGGR